MRASIQEQTGSVGAHEVAADFERIGWGAAENSQHDLGTDLFLMARDSRLIDLGMVVGAQVKAGPSWFTEVARDEDGGVTGWWFRESTQGHFDAWLSHQLPHIIVLHDIDARISYWAHITSDAVKYTPKGAKILVPACNTVDAANTDKLLSVAASKSSQVSWEGSAWAGAELPPSHQLRHALLVPRLVAPHPNRSTTGPLSAVQVTALLVQVRFRDLAEEREQQKSLPDLKALPPKAGWDWRFAAGMREFITTGRPDALATLADATRPPHQQAAATAAYAAALLENGRPAEALHALDVLLSRDQLELVDHAWIQLQHARALHELGRRREARDEALGLVSLAQRAPGDVTAAAIGGAAAHTVFMASDWGTEDIEMTISASDTTAAWWGQQVSSWGLAAQAKKQFREWGRDSAVTLIGGDETWRYLRSASLLPGLLGDQGRWRSTTGQLAVYMLSDRNHGAEPDMAASALSMLRRSGDHKGLRLAVHRIVTDGPASAARVAALEVRPEESTHTSVHADLMMLIEAGDLLPHDRAETLAEWAQHTFTDPAQYTAHTRPTFRLCPMLVDLMSALVDALGETAQRDLSGLVVDLPIQSDQSIANPLARLVRRLPATVWTPDRAQRAAERADADNWELTYALLEVAAPHVPEVRDRLKAEAQLGSMNAVQALGPVSDLDLELVTSLVASITTKLEAKIRDAQRGAFAYGSHDLGHAITLLNLRHPEVANWDIVYRLLESTRWGELLNGALRLLADSTEELPGDVGIKLLPLAEAIANGTAPNPRLFASADPRPTASRLLAKLKSQAGKAQVEHLSSLARGGPAQRCAAALVADDAADPLSLGFLIALAGDPEPQVRACAGRMIAQRTAAGDTTARAQLPILVEDRGVLVAQAIAATAVAYPLLANLDELQPLRTHISAKVRLAMRYADER